MSDVPPPPRIPGYRDLTLHRDSPSAHVYRAVSERLNIPVAVKLLRIDATVAATQLRDELHTAMRLPVAPHIVRIMDIGIADGRPFLAMEFCEDGSYAELLNRSGPLAIDDAVKVGIAVASALQATHEVGILHQGVSPGNVLRSTSGPALTDFAIAQKPAELAGKALFTPRHAAPEVLLLQPSSVASDIYSLGSTLWCLLAGRAPYEQADEDPDPLTYRERVLNRPVPLVPRPDVPVWLQTEVARAMSKRPADRHPSAAAFGEALRRGRAQAHLPAAGPSAPAEPVADSPDASVGAWISPGGWSGDPSDPSPVGATIPLDPAAPDHAPWMRPGSVRWDFPPEFPPAADTAPQVQPADTHVPNSAPVAPPVDLPATPAQPGPTVVARRPTHRTALVAAAVTGVVGMVLSGLVLLVLQLPPGGRPDGRASGSPGSSASIVTDKAPGDVKLADRGTAVVISWTDHTGNSAPHYIVGGPQGTTPRAMTQAEKGVSRVTIEALNPDTNYCFTVIAVISVDEVAPSGQICTNRE